MSFEECVDGHDMDNHPDNQVFMELADLFVNDEIISELHLGSRLRCGELDYSVDSLSAVDDYLEAFYQSPGSDEDVFRAALRSGAYVGEVLRRSSPNEMYWLQYDNAEASINAATNGTGKQLSTLGVLARPDGMSFPIGKTVKLLGMGREESTKFFVESMLHSVG